MPEPGATASPALSSAVPGVLGRCSCGGSCDRCQAEQEHQHEWLQMQHAASGDLGQKAAPPIVHEVLRSPGRRLDPVIRGFMGPRFGYDLGDVRVHTAARAAESARTVSARAYTVGHQIVFASGQYEPATAEGRKLIAHELAQLSQQGTGSRASAKRISIAADSAAQGVERAPSALAGPTDATTTEPAQILHRQAQAKPPMGSPPGAELAPPCASTSCSAISGDRFEKQPPELQRVLAASLRASDLAGASGFRTPDRLDRHLQRHVQIRGLVSFAPAPEDRARRAAGSGPLPDSRQYSLGALRQRALACTVQRAHGDRSILPGIRSRGESASWTNDFT